MTLILLLAVLAQLAPAPRGAAAGASPVPLVDSVQVAAFGDDRSAFSVHFGELTSDYRVMAMFVLPGQRVPIAVDGSVATDDTARYTLDGGSGTAVPNGTAQWTWTAPVTPGVAPVEVRDSMTGQTMTLNVFVMVPYSAMRRGTLNGYHIGAYPAPRRGYESEYQRPLGFVEVTPSVEDVAVSPHFTLGQFMCKQDGDPRYVVLRQPLLEKLERLLTAVNEHGIEAKSFSIMSAYRTPHYNAAIGNKTIFSRHEYGDAADVFVDEDHDGIMDDLNHDGRHTIADAKVLGAIVNQKEADAPEFAGLIGGLGTYAPTTGHGPFMHVDVRGFQVEWGS